MFILFLCTLILILFVINSNLVISGASFGLMLWYKNVLPMLLPFMLISGVIVSQMNILMKENPGNKVKKALFTTMSLGFFCGYPIGAKTCSEFVQNNTIKKSTGNIILPLCNNVSPMFISGYVVHRILKNHLSFFQVIVLIYLPYVIISVISYLTHSLLTKREIVSVSETDEANTTVNNTGLNQYLINSISQITLVGIYIMSCSIIIQFISSIPGIFSPVKEILSGIMEITRGCSDISALSDISVQTKTALIISITSFGGVSSILQTQMVIQKSGLSIIYYTVIKAICAFFSYILCMLFI